MPDMTEVLKTPTDSVLNFLILSKIIKVLYNTREIITNAIQVLVEEPLEFPVFSETTTRLPSDNEASLVLKPRNASLRNFLEIEWSMSSFFSDIVLQAVMFLSIRETFFFVK